MNSVFKGTILSLGLGFAAAFGIIVLPAFLKSPDVFGAFAAGFVNPFAAGYSMDTIFCWLILAIWVGYEARVRQMRYGWVCLLLGIVPGVATGFALCLLIRMYRVNKNAGGGTTKKNHSDSCSLQSVCPPVKNARSLAEKKLPQMEYPFLIFELSLLYPAKLNRLLHI